MVFENFSEWLTQFSIQDVFRGDFSSFIPIFYLAISIAIYAIFIWHFYRFIARRDIFKLSPKKHGKAVAFLKYSLLFPFIAVLFFAGFSMMLLFLTKNLDSLSILTTSFAVILAIRITAYYSEDLSKDLAKLLPLALLGVFLVDPSYFRLDDVTNKVNSLPNFLTLAVQLVLFVIIAEWVLRILLKIKQSILPKKQQIQES